MGGAGEAAGDGGVKGFGKVVWKRMKAVGEVEGVRQVTGCGESLGCWGS